MKMTIKEYAETRGVTYENVRQMLDRHKDKLEGHLTKEGRTTYLSDQAQQILSDIAQNKTITVISEKGENVDLRARLEEKDKIIEELEKQLNEIQLKQENKLLKFQNETLEKVSELEKIISNQKSLVDNSQLLLEQKDKEKADLEKEKANLEEEKDKQIDLIATNRQARREYKKAKKKEQKEKDKQEKQNTDD